MTKIKNKTKNKIKNIRNILITAINIYSIITIILIKILGLKANK